MRGLQSTRYVSYFVLRNKCCALSLYKDVRILEVKTTLESGYYININIKQLFVGNILASELVVYEESNN